MLVIISDMRLYDNRFLFSKASSMAGSFYLKIYFCQGMNVA